MASERQVHNSVSPWWGEHIHRYNEAIKSIKKDHIVLDLACGTGYGTKLVAPHCSKVIGGDISEETVAFNSENYSGSGIDFQLLDGVALPFEDNYFDTVISFETIEHTTKFDQMLSEFKRVLKPSGKAFISTPNIVVNSPTSEILNKFHTQEWNYEEFKEILSRHFSEFQLSGQENTRYESGSLLAKIAEKILLQRGVRKIPIPIQNRLMKKLGKPGIYPHYNEFKIVNDENKIKRCKQFFAICK